MKILNQDLITSVSASTGALSATYSEENVLNDFPNQGFISSGTSETLTIICSSGAQALFFSALMADSATITATDTEAALPSSFTLNTTPRSTLRELNDGQDYLLPPEWFDLTRLLYTSSDAPVYIGPTYSGGTVNGTTGATSPLTLTGTLTLAGTLIAGLAPGESYLANSNQGEALSASSITITLSSTVDRKDLPVKGNSIYRWIQNTGATGRFEDSLGAAININDHAQIHIGSLVTISGSTYSIVKIVGDGTQAGDIELSGSPSDGVIFSIKNPIRLGILRAGSVLDIQNPKLGFSQALLDFSIRNPIANGRYNHIPRNVAKTFTAQFIMSDTNAREVEGFAYAYRSKPFPAILVENLDSSLETETRNSGFFYFVNLPSFNYAINGGAFSNITMSFREVL